MLALTIYVNDHKISGITGPKFTKFLSDVDKSSWIAAISVALFPFLVKCQHKQ